MRVLFFFQAEDGIRDSVLTGQRPALNSGHLSPVAVTLMVMGVRTSSLVRPWTIPEAWRMLVASSCTQRMGLSLSDWMAIRQMVTTEGRYSWGVISMEMDFPTLWWRPPGYSPLTG